jgi:hypothetical protein
MLCIVILIKAVEQNGLRLLNERGLLPLVPFIFQKWGILFLLKDFDERSEFAAFLYGPSMALR